LFYFSEQSSHSSVRIVELMLDAFFSVRIDALRIVEGLGTSLIFFFNAKQKQPSVFYL